MTSVLVQGIDSWIDDYPDRRIRRLLHRLPILLWRLGVGRPLGGPFMVVTTTGRRSGRAIHTALMPHPLDGVVYVWCPYGDVGQWWRNVVADPVVTVQDASGTWSARANPIADDAEIARVHAMLLAFDAGLLRRYAAAQGIEPTAADFRAHREQLHLRRLEPISGPSPQAVRADLIWVWGLVPLAALLALVTRRVRSCGPRGTRPCGTRTCRPGTTSRSECCD